MMTRISAFVALFILAACQLVEAPGEDGAAAATTTAPSVGGQSPLIMEQQCKAAGGKVVIGLAGAQCARAQPDAGKACTSSSECSGVCLAAARSCSPVTPFFGCHEVLNSGKKAIICID